MDPVRAGQDLKLQAKGVLAMLEIIIFVVATSLVGLAVLFGLTPDTRPPGRYWYAAGPDPEPWRTD